MTVKMKKGDIIANINDSPESIAHAYSLGFVPVDKAEVETKLKADITPAVETPNEQPRRGRPPKNEQPVVNPESTAGNPDVESAQEA